MIVHGLAWGSMAKDCGEKLLALVDFNLCLVCLLWQSFDFEDLNNLTTEYHLSFSVFMTSDQFPIPRLSYCLAA